MTQKHTPGPWHMGEGNGEGCVFKTGEGRSRFEPQTGTALFPICSFAMGWSDEEDMANGRLLAAAPDLLEALRYALGCIESGDTSDMQPVREAIAKAEGK